MPITLTLHAKKLVYIHLGRCNCCPCRLLSVECRNLIRSHHNLVGYHKPRPGGPLHRIQVVLVGVGSGKEEIGNGRRRRRPFPISSLPDPTPTRTTWIRWRGPPGLGLW